MSRYMTKELLLPAMLIKMAYIKEGLGDYTSALLYLDGYYKHTANKRAIAKMSELASENSLDGYEYSDYTYMNSTVNKYRMPYFDHVLCAIRCSP